MIGLLACSSGDPAEVPRGDHDSGEDSGSPQAHEPERLFSFGLLADSHVTGTGDHLDRLGLAVDALEAEAADLAFVAVLGDIAWGGGWELARERLDSLSVPWVPVFGDNPIQVGEETDFHETFGAHLDALGPALEGWTVAPVPVTPPPEAPVDAEQAWLHNARFEVQGVRFVVLDVNSRQLDTFWGETPDLHDFDGGTLPFLEEALETAPEGPEGRVVLLSHMPLLDSVGSLDLEEIAVFQALMARWPGLAWGNFAGHLHGDGEGTWEDLPFEVVVTDATWDDEIRVRRVEVWTDGLRLDYRHESVLVPGP